MLHIHDLRNSDLFELKKKSIVALSSEYVVASYATFQTICLEMLFEELKIMEHKKMKLFVDNKSAIDLENHLVCHGRSKYIERRYHFLRGQINKGNLESEY